MPVGRTKDPTMNRVGKKELLERIKPAKGNGLFVKDVVRMLVDTPEDPFNRPRVASIWQGFAELHNEGWVTMFDAYDRRTGKLEKMVMIRAV